MWSLVKRNDVTSDKEDENPNGVFDPRNVSVPRMENVSSVTVTISPPVTRMAIPRKTMLEASVAMNELIWTMLTSTPLTTPSTAPIRTPAAMPGHGGNQRQLACGTAATAKIAPTDKSKTPAMMPIVTPQATMPTGADWSRMLSRLRRVKNRSWPG